MAGCLIIPSSGIPFHLNDQITVRGAAPIYMAGPPSSASGSDIMLVQIRCDLVAVSYTHLDVYKRQLLHVRVLTIHDSR